MCHEWGTREVHTEFLWGNMRSGVHMEDLGLRGRIILKCILLKLDGRAWSWIHLAEDTDKWRDFVTAVNERGEFVE